VQEQLAFARCPGVNKLIWLIPAGRQAIEQRLRAIKPDCRLLSPAANADVPHHQILGWGPFSWSVP